MMLRRAALLLLALSACGSSPTAPDGEAGDAAVETGDVSNDSASPQNDARDGGYVTGDGACTPGVPHCNGDFGYRMCNQDGTWGEPQSCAGYSSNGTTSYCAEIPADTGEPWGTCIDPACWYWRRRGAPGDATAVGICEPDGTIRKCSAGGTLSPAVCAGTCTRVGTLDARVLGYCAPACEDGARECVGGPFYRTCVGGRWDAAPKSCAGACNPVGSGSKSDIKCGGTCEAGTSRCRADLGAVEVCTPAGAWAADRTCLLGRCRPAGPQAQCEAECAAGQRSCAFDGAGAERRCDDAGRWTAEMTCAAGTSCRLSGGVALGCVACVGAHQGGGNAYGAADSRCVPDGGVEACGEDDAWHPADSCACVEVTRGASSLAACQ